MRTDKQDFTKTSRDRAKELIRAGKTEEAIKEVDRIWEEERPIHDLYGDMTAVLLDYVKDKLGEPAVEEAWRFVGERVWRPILEGFRDKSSGFLLRPMRCFCVRTVTTLPAPKTKKSMYFDCNIVQVAGVYWKKEKPRIPSAILSRSA